MSTTSAPLPIVGPISPSRMVVDRGTAYGKAQPPATTADIGDVWAREGGTLTVLEVRSAGEWGHVYRVRLHSGEAWLYDHQLEAGWKPAA